GPLRMDAAVLGAELDCCSGAGVSAYSIRSAFRLTSCSFFVLGLKDLQIQHFLPGMLQKLDVKNWEDLKSVFAVTTHIFSDGITNSHRQTRMVKCSIRTVFMAFAGISGLAVSLANVIQRAMECLVPVLDYLEVLIGRKAVYGMSFISLAQSCDHRSLEMWTSVFCTHCISSCFGLEVLKSILCK
uniref:Uncharacterized protein n=1 Tax=Chelonoidis abingdonii TaxID=106734 RepID=A0A8C0G6P4_CHEAB